MTTQLFESMIPSVDNQGQMFVSSVAVCASLVAGIIIYTSTSSKNQKNKSLGEDSNDGIAVRPPHVRSYLPYIGSAIEMGAGITDFIKNKSKQLNNTPIFTATILGDHCIFIADSEYITTVFKPKYTKYLDALSLQKDFSTSVLTYTSQDIQEGFSINNNKIANKQFHQYLFKKEELEKSMNKAQESFLKFLPQLTSTDKTWTQHNLFDFVVTSVVKATLGPLLSDHLAQDIFMPDFQTFDKGIIPLFNKMPNILTKNVRNARDKLMKEVQSDDFWKYASSWMKARRETFGAKTFFNKSNTGILWASVGNSGKFQWIYIVLFIDFLLVCTKHKDISNSHHPPFPTYTAPAIFWTTLLLIEHPEAFKACRKQVDEVVAKRTSKSDYFTIEELDQLTFLDSALTEALRMYQGNFTPRLVIEDFILETTQQKFLIKKGSKIMTWWGVLHNDPDIFDKPNEFRYDRFVNTKRTDFSYKSGKTLTHDPVIAFGGGEHLCPGRKFISYEARLFLAQLLQNFDMKMADGETRPGIDLTMMGIGVTHPDKDPKVEIRCRSDQSSQ